MLRLLRLLKMEHYIPCITLLNEVFVRKKQGLLPFGGGPVVNGRIQPELPRVLSCSSPFQHSCVVSPLATLCAGLFIAGVDVMVLWIVFAAGLHITERDDFTHAPSPDEPVQAWRYRNVPNSMQYGQDWARDICSQRTV